MADSNEVPADAPAVLGTTVGRGRLSRQAIYDWESGRFRLPAAVLLAAADIAGMDLSDVLNRARIIRGPRNTEDLSDAAGRQQ